MGPRVSAADTQQGTCHALPATHSHVRFVLVYQWHEDDDDDDDDFDLIIYVLIVTAVDFRWCY